MHFNLIGAGRLGTHLAAALIYRANWQLIALCNQQFNHAKNSITQLGHGDAVATIAALPHAGVTFITTPDDALAEVVQALSQHPHLQPGDIIVHCSGVYSSTLLYPLKARGCHVASIHPLKAFLATAPDPDAFYACDCTIEGDVNAVTLLTTLFGQLGAKVVSLSTEKKALYHAAAAMASNYLVTLASCATSLFVDAGIAQPQAKQMCERLMENNLGNIKESNLITQALTGPLMRGDINTIRLHLKAITPPHIEGLYRAAGLATLPLTNNSDTQLSILKSLFTQSGAPE